jgi:hypothetical protein
MRYVIIREIYKQTPQIGHIWLNPSLQNNDDAKQNIVESEDTRGNI